MNIWIDDCASGGYLYRVMRGQAVYDTFVSKKALTWKEQRDIAAGYREALEGYGKG